MDTSVYAMYYFAIRRFGPLGLRGAEIDQYARALLANPESCKRIRQDYDRAVSDGHPDFLNAMTGE